jgi:hypothetical protein
MLFWGYEIAKVGLGRCDDVCAISRGLNARS